MTGIKSRGPVGAFNQSNARAAGVIDGRVERGKGKIIRRKQKKEYNGKDKGEYRTMMLGLMFNTCR